MKTSWKIGAGVVAGLLVGFVIGSSVQTSGFTAGSGKGDISKVSKYNRSVVSPAMSSFQEKILNDSTAMKNTAASLALMNNRMTEFDKLVEVAVKASEGIDELGGVLTSLQKVSRLAENAKEASEQALQAFDAMLSGDKTTAPNQYETASQNLALAYLMVDRQLNVGKEFVCEVDNYLKGKKAEENLDLVMARDLWLGYCACEAVLTKDSEALAYWKDKKVIADEQMLGSMDVKSLEAYESMMGFQTEILSLLAPEFSNESGLQGFSRNAPETIEFGSKIDNFEKGSFDFLSNAEQTMDVVLENVIGYNQVLKSNLDLNVLENSSGNAPKEPGQN